MKCTIADRKKAARVLADDSVYIPTNGCKCPNPEGIADELLLSPAAHIIMPDPDVLMIFILQNFGLYMMHIAVLPEARGKRAFEASKNGLKWLFENTDCIRVMGLVPKCWPHCLRYALAVGFKKVGILRDSIVLNGKTYDQTIVEV